MRRIIIDFRDVLLVFRFSFRYSSHWSSRRTLLRNAPFESLFLSLSLSLYLPTYLSSSLRASRNVSPFLQLRLCPPEDFQYPRNTWLSLKFRYCEQRALSAVAAPQICTGQTEPASSQSTKSLHVAISL